MPRSGSTLIESILQSSNQKISSLGESSIINFSDTKTTLVEFGTQKSDLLIGIINNSLFSYTIGASPEHTSTLNFINDLSVDDLSTIRDPIGKPNYSIANMLGHILVEQSMHMGQIAYLRGIQKGLNQ